MSGKQELAIKRPEFCFYIPRHLRLWTPRPPKRKEIPPQPTLDISNPEEFPRLASGRKRERKGSKTVAKSSPADTNLFFDEMTLLECCSYCDRNCLEEDQQGGVEGSPDHHGDNDPVCCSPEGEETISLQTNAEPLSPPCDHHKSDQMCSPGPNYRPNMYSRSLY